MSVFMAPGDTVASVRLDDGQVFKLGRIKPKARPPALRLANYFRAPKAGPPPSFDYAGKARDSIKHVYLNDRYGCCVISGKAHHLGVWSANDADSGGLVLATDQEILEQYHGICGPGDNGCVITNVLDVMRTRGFKAGGKYYKIDGYVSVDWWNKLLVQTALYLFGGLTLGINLPAAWSEGGDGSLWDETNTRIVGGHDVDAIDADEQGVRIATWGGTRRMTWPAFLSRKWIEECYLLLAPLWYGNDQLAPSGIDVSALKADLAKLDHGEIPSIDPIVPPPPPPPGPQPAGRIDPNKIFVAIQQPTGNEAYGLYPLSGPKPPPADPNNPPFGPVL